MPQTFRASQVATPRGSRVAVYEAGAERGTRILVVGGFTSRPVCEGPLVESLGKAISRGARCTMIDLASCGNSRCGGELTMDTWVEDLAFVAGARSDADTVFVGLSMGAWVMLALHQRERLPVRAMCALAPAIDWDAEYVWPGIERGRFRKDGKYVMTAEKRLLPVSLLESMEKFRLNGKTFEARAPIHVIQGERDELVSFEAARKFARGATGSPCTFESLPEQDHQVSKLMTIPARLAFERWLLARVPEAAA
ncbi:MAG: alpha/beta fold hydrolase [Burkholderiales bacterium]|nr:alpha/beta fold hydrolase [Burkholderiales bacterium]